MVCRTTLMSRSPRVTLTITNVDGSAVFDVFGNPVTTTTTDADGSYSFDFLPLRAVHGDGDDAGGVRADHRRCR
jgi:hypothetical protein